MIGFATAEPTCTEETLAGLWKAYWDKGAECIDRLIEAYLPFVHRVLKRIAIRLPSHIAQEDLAQVALMGLYKSILDFKPQRGVPFEGYAYRRIRGAILDELRANDHLSRGKRAKVDQVESIIVDWMKEHRTMPSEEDIAAQLGLTVSAFHQLMDEAKPWCSLDVADADDVPLCETIADPSASSDKNVQNHDMQKLIREGFRELEMREQKILYLYYFEDLRLSEIAELFNLSEARISQIHALSVVRLRAVLTDSYPDEFTSEVA